MNKPNLPSYRSECGLRLRASRRSLLMGAAAVVAAIALSSPASPVPSQASSPTMLAFQTMIGDVGPYVGPANPIRDIPGAGAPWFISSATGRLPGYQRGPRDPRQPHYEKLPGDALGR